jgi:signal transduction histidine kinase
LHNIVKHSGASDVVLKLQQTRKGFIITIQDNGCGFDPANQKYKGNGLANMKKRTEEIGGKFILQSSPGSGSLLQITI